MRLLCAIAIAMFMLATPGVTLAAGSSAVGTWQVTSTTDTGEQNVWKMVLTEQDGKLAGTLAGDMGEMQLENVRFEKGVLTFAVKIGEDTYTVEAKVKGEALEGTFKGAQTGAVKGSRQN